MKQTSFAVGEPVRITAGTYKDAEGIIEDLQPECDAVRIHTKNGAAYAFLENMVRVAVPMPKPTKAVLSRK
jgi:transcription antitermination factor NusG